MPMPMDNSIPLGYSLPLTVRTFYGVTTLKDDLSQMIQYMPVRSKK
jgi:hypothetical protein